MAKKINLKIGAYYLINKDSVCRLENTTSFFKGAEFSILAAKKGSVDCYWVIQYPLREILVQEITTQDFPLYLSWRTSPRFSQILKEAQHG